MALPLDTSFKFKFCESKERELFYEGGAAIPEGGNYLRLIKTDDDGEPLPNKFGRVRYHKPVRFKLGAARADFDTTVKFLITKRESTSATAANGLVFFIVPNGHIFPLRPEGRSLGVFDESGSGKGVFAVEVNTFPEGENMRVGIDVGSNLPVEYKRLPRKFVGEEVTLHIKYVAAKQKITVRASLATDLDYVPLSVVRDWSHALPTRGEVGLAAATGDHTALHDVTYWKFTSTFANDKGAYRFAIASVLVLGLVCACVLARALSPSGLALRYY